MLFPASLVAGGMLKQQVACAITHTLCSTCPEGSGVSGIASNQLGFLLAELDLYILMQQRDLNSCSMTEFEEKLVPLMPLSPSPADMFLFLFFCSLKKGCNA